LLSSSNQKVTASVQIVISKTVTAKVGARSKQNENCCEFGQFPGPNAVWPACAHRRFPNFLDGTSAKIKRGNGTGAVERSAGGCFATIAA